MRGIGKMEQGGAVRKIGLIKKGGIPAVKMQDNVLPPVSGSMVAMFIPAVDQETVPFTEQIVFPAVFERPAPGQSEKDQEGIVVLSMCIK